jgi:hypothetical protein
MMSELKDCRLRKKLTQQEAAEGIGISLRSYITYENDDSKWGTPKYRFLMQEIERINPLDEEHGILTLSEIQKSCAEVFSEFGVEFCYLFGSYADGTPRHNSDINLVIAPAGINCDVLEDRLKSVLHKRIGILTPKHLLNNESLISAVLKGGIRIFPESGKPGTGRQFSRR